MKGTEGEISIKAFLNNSARPYMGIVRDKVMGFDWLIRLDWFLICQLEINSFCAFLEPSLYHRAHSHPSGVPQ